jgi:glycosyltransferase involved in cell wall biosynthesis
MKIKFSVITVVKNGMPYLEDSLRSYHEQEYSNKELIVVASKSHDSTGKFLLQNKKKINKLIINSSLNLYESLNKGISLATGNYIIVLHSDDIFFHKNILTKVASFIKKKNFADIIFGDIIYVDRNYLKKITRVWKSKKFNDYPKAIKYGWAPPHTAIFIKKSIYKNYSYLTNFKISSDYDLVIKVFNNNNIIKQYFPNYISIMREGGVSTANIKNLILKLKEDYKIIKLNKINLISLIIKRLIKIFQFFPLLYIKQKIEISKSILQNNSIIVTKNMNYLNKTNKFIYSALNLAFLGFINKIEVNRNYVLWPDGIGSKFIDYKLKKTPGRALVEPLLKRIKHSSLIVIGNYNIRTDLYLKKFTKRVRYFSLPFGDINIILKSVNNLKINKNELIFLNIPTPKQEILANLIYQNNKNARIVCIGGGLNMASGLEKKVPKIIDNIGAEFLWRLKQDTTRRLGRLILSFFGLLYNYRLIKIVSKNFKILKT